MVKEKLSNIGICLICYYIMNSMFLGVGLYNMFLLSKEATFICIIIGSIIGLIPISIYLYIFKNNNYENIFVLNVKLFGKIFGNIINGMLSVLAIFITTIVLYNLTMFLNLNYLVLTDKMYIAFLLIIPVIYAISKGIGTIEKTAQILIYIIIICFFIALIGLIPTIDIDNILPIFTANISRYIYSILTYVAFNTIPLFLILSISKNDLIDKEKFSKDLLKTYIISNVMIFFLFFVTLAGLGYPIVSVLKYPEFLILKEISLLGIIERVENIISMYFIIPMIMMVIISIYYSYVNFSRYSKNKVYKKAFTYILPILVYILSIVIFKNITISTTFNLTLLPVIIGVTAIILHLIITLRIIFQKHIK